MATAAQHSRRSAQRAVLQRLAIWRAGQQQLALLLRSLVALRLAVCHWRKLVQRRRSKRCMQEKAAQHWQQRGCRRLVLLWHWWAAPRRHADMACLRSSWRRWRSGILARALLTRVFSTMEQCWAARRHQRELLGCAGS
jgi:hypothetical protein